MRIQTQSTALTIVLATVGGFLLQPVSQLAVADSPRTQSRSDAEHNAADSSSALIFPHERQIEQSLEFIRKHLDAGEFVLAAGLLRQTLDSQTTSYLGDTTGETAVSSRKRALNLMRRLPAEIRGSLEEDLDRTARETWKTLKISGTQEELARFVDQYRETLWGLEALQTLAATHRDAGRFQLAAIAFEEIIAHPRSTGSQKAFAAVARVASLLASGRTTEARRAAIEHSQIVNDESAISIGGRKVNPSQWIEARLLESESPERKETVSAGSSDMSLPLPGLNPIWTRQMGPAFDPQKEIGTVSDLQKMITGVQRYFREQGVVSSLASRPIVVGNLVIARTMEEISAFDLATGDKLWWLPNQEYGWLSKPSNLWQSNSNNREMIARAWHRRIEADSVFHSLASDGRLLVVVQEPDRSHLDFPGPARPGIPNNSNFTGVRWNRLFGYEVSSKELRWQIGGLPRGAADVFGGMTFLGAPLFVDDLLFCIARRNDELSLLALNRDTGHLQWSVKLGILPPHIADAVSRRRIACPISLVGGKLLCPTASGSLIAVDPITRAISWAFRYPVVQHDVPSRPFNGQVMSVQTDAWWNEWREVSCITQQISVPGSNVDGRPVAKKHRQITVMASPDSGVLSAVGTDDGSSFWDVPRSGALSLLGITDDQAIVLEPMAIRSHDLLTGVIRWRAETGEISGRGVIVGRHLIQPRRAGGLAVVDLRNGTVSGRVADAGFVTGSLVPCEGGWITQNEQSLMRLPYLDHLRKQAIEHYQASQDGANSVALARLDLQSGDPIAADSRLETIRTAEARELRREALISILKNQGHDSARNGQEGNLDPIQAEKQRNERGQQLLSLCESKAERLVALRALGEIAWAAGDSLSAIDLFLEGLDLIDAIGLRELGDWSPNEASSRTVRPDRVLLGAIERILDHAERASSQIDGDSRLQREIESRLNAQLTVARGSNDPFALQRQLDRFLPLEWGRRALIADPSAAVFARPLAKVEPALQSAIGSQDRMTSARAAFQLAQLYSRSGWRIEAEAVERRLLVESPGIPVNESQTITTALATDPGRQESLRKLLSPIADPWPDVMPTVERSPKQRRVAAISSVYHVPVKVKAEPGSLLDRLDVSVDRNGHSVRFTGEGQAEPWIITLPGSPRMFRANFANYDLVEAYGVGRLLILRVGSEVFGIQPLNDHGEPRKTVTQLQFDIESSAEFPADSAWVPEIVPEKPGIRPMGIRVIDGFGHSLGGLGPVRAGYLCYRSQARLVAVETQSGRRLWERLDLPARCLVFGDDERVYLWRTEERSLQVLSAVDGRIIEERTWDVSSDDLLMQHGSRCWVVMRRIAHSGTVAHEVSIGLVDARDASTVWTRSFPQNSVPFSIDQDTVGVVETSGLLHILSADSGAPLGEALTVEVPERIERVVCLRDAQRWYLAISGPVSRLPILQTEQVWGGLHLAFVHGWLYGIDHRTASISWKRFLDNEALPREAPKTSPVLVQMWRKSNGDGVQNGEGILRLIDKRNGNLIDTTRDPLLQPYFALQPAENCEMLQIMTERETIRLNYKPIAQEAEQQRAIDQK